ncbi:DUF748 domain-containing protein [Pseudomaricurvus alcaniphilus]|uniref:DUF748 domain-containing protein n=1 Tax=Pseudomaricurvus alcaniphilus TaxID=1166482 RepID=UPI00140BB25C|nr:DUF748 domain-containing protein [Pseudomaricurvus alcaniphilus]NHN38578.1 DUF748 domain-containing protein [Pseudomaricurvus alcaniphilus]
MKRSLRIARNTVIVLLLILALVPLLVSEGAKFAGKRFLQEQGLSEVQIGRLWVNPYTGFAEIKDVSFQQGAEPFALQLLQARVSLRDLWSKKITVEKVALAGFKLALVEAEDGQLQINGIVLVPGPVAEPEPETGEPDLWHLALRSISVEDVQLLVQTAQLHTRVKLQALTLSGLDTQSGSEASFSGALQLVDLNLPESGTELSTRVQIKSRAKLGLTADGWSLAGRHEIELADTRALLPPRQLGAQKMTLTLDGDLDMSERLDYRATLAFAVNQLRLADAASDQSQLQLQRGTLGSEITLGLQGQGWNLVTDNRIQLTGLDALAEPYRVLAESAELDIDAAADNTGQLNYRTRSGAVLAGLQLLDQRTEANLLSLAQANIDAVALGSEAPGELQLAALGGEGLVFLPASTAKQKTLIDDAAFTVSGLKLALPQQAQDPLLVAIERVSLPRGEIHLLRGAKGDFPQLLPLQAAAAAPQASESPTVLAEAQVELPVEPQQEPPGTAPAADDAAAPMQLTVAEISIGPQVRVSIEDRGVSPALRETIEVRQFQVNNFDLTGSGNAQLQATLGLTHEAVLALAGDFNLQGKSVDLKADLKDYQILQASGYSKRTTGYALEAGTLDLNSNIKISANKLALDNKIRIDQLSLRAANDDKALKFANQLAMPLDQALDLLRDNKNRIKLQVPVSGALDDPSVDFNNIINRALGGAMKKASISVLKNLLQPYSTIFSVAKFAGEQLSKVRLQPMSFAAGEAALEDKNREYATKIASILTKKEKVKLKVCGVTNGEDARRLAVAAQQSAAALPGTAGPVASDPSPAAGTTAEQSAPQPPLTPAEALAAMDPAELANQLRQLGEQRSNGLRRYLIDELRVDKEQLLVCLPDHSESLDAVAGVELLL